MSLAPAQPPAIDSWRFSSFPELAGRSHTRGLCFEYEPRSQEALPLKNLGLTSPGLTSPLHKGGCPAHLRADPSVSLLSGGPSLTGPSITTWRSVPHGTHYRHLAVRPSRDPLSPLIILTLVVQATAVDTYFLHPITPLCNRV